MAAMIAPPIVSAMRSSTVSMGALALSAAPMIATMALNAYW